MTMHPEDYQDSLRTDRHAEPRCESCQRPADSDGLDDDGLCPDCAPEDERPVGEVPPYVGRRGGVA